MCNVGVPPRTGLENTAILYSPEHLYNMCRMGPFCDTCVVFKKLDAGRLSLPLYRCVGHFFFFFNCGAKKKEHTVLH